jgi:hypothetical protein
VSSKRENVGNKERKVKRMSSLAFRGDEEKA